MQTKSLNERVSIGSSRYEIGTLVETSEVIDSGTWDERIWVNFPNGEGTYLNPNKVQ